MENLFGNWELETGNRELETGNRKPETGNWELGIGREGRLVF